MFSEIIIRRAFMILAGTVLLTSAPARADIQLGIQGGLGSTKDICLEGLTIFVTVSGNECGDGRIDPTEFRVNGSSGDVVFDASTGAASFSAPVTISGTNFQASGLQAFSGTTTFNSTVSFVGSSVTFMTGTTFTQPSTFNNTADFNNTITTAGLSNTGNISNTGTITTTTLLGTAVNTTNFLATGNFVISNGATVTMGINVVSGVAAGVADTDAVNVAQLNAATTGITADVTALETDVTALEATTATHTTQITNLQTGLAQTNEDLADETAARIAADAALGDRVSALEAVTADLDDRFDRAGNRADAGTATAVALSGAMFLPGKTFNLTGNVGAYHGAVAGALQIGALVSDTVAVNAGIAKSFNKGGRTAMRAGFTLGW